MIDLAGLKDAKRGSGGSAVFIARNRFAVLDKAAGEILIKNLRNEITKKTPAPVSGTDALFYAGTGMLLCRAEDKVRDSTLLYLTFSRNSADELPVSSPFLRTPNL